MYGIRNLTIMAVSLSSFIMSLPWPGSVQKRNVKNSFNLAASAVFVSLVITLPLQELSQIRIGTNDSHGKLLVMELYRLAVPDTFLLHGSGLRFSTPSGLLLGGFWYD
jgi:hypothetical protein